MSETKFRAFAHDSSQSEHPTNSRTESLDLKARAIVMICPVKEPNWQLRCGLATFDYTLTSRRGRIILSRSERTRPARLVGVRPSLSRMTSPPNTCSQRMWHRSCFGRCRHYARMASRAQRGGRFEVVPAATSMKPWDSILTPSRHLSQRGRGDRYPEIPSRGGSNSVQKTSSRPRCTVVR
jgi:hypothetical protein